MSQVAYASGSGFAGVRSFDRQEEYAARTKTRREERDAARADQTREILEQNAFRRTAPAHCRRLEQFTLEWFLACDRAFRAAMHAAGYQECTGKSQLNNAGSTR